MCMITSADCNRMCVWCAPFDLIDVRMMAPFCPPSFILRVSFINKHVMCILMCQSWRYHYYPWCLLSAQMMCPSTLISWSWGTESDANKHMTVLHPRRSQCPNSDVETTKGSAAISNPYKSWWGAPSKSTSTRTSPSITHHSPASLIVWRTLPLQPS